MTNESLMDMGVRDCLVDIFEKNEKIRVVAELSGVNEDITLDLNEYMLGISAKGG